MASNPYTGPGVDTASPGGFREFPREVVVSASPLLEAEIAAAMQTLTDEDIALANAIVNAYSDGKACSANAPLAQDIK